MKSQNSILFILTILLFFFQQSCNSNSPKKKPEIKVNSNNDSLTGNKDLNQNCRLKLNFRDNLTGQKVFPNSISFKNLQTGEIFNKVISDSILMETGLTYNLPWGEYDILIETKNYLQSNSRLRLNTYDIELTFEVEPLSAVREDINKYIQSLHDSKSMVIYGFVTDDLNNNPLPNVDVYTEDKKARDTTNSNGFFKLLIPLPKKNENVDERNSICFFKPGFNKSIWRSFDMYPFGDLGFKVRLKKGNSIEKVIVQKDKSPEIIYTD